jgi:hypothetical protein
MCIKVSEPLCLVYSLSRMPEVTSRALLLAPNLTNTPLEEHIKSLGRVLLKGAPAALDECL